MAKTIGTICTKHPELNGLRYGGKLCVACQNARTKEYYLRNKEKHKKVVADYYHKVTKKKRAENPGHFKEIQQRFRERHPERPRQWAKRWRDENRAQWLANGKQAWIRRYAMIGGQKIAAAYSKQIKEIYDRCPEGHHVDHIVPLRGKGVNGLHVPWNLQYLPANENRRKGNRLEA